MMSKKTKRPKKVIEPEETGKKDFTRLISGALLGLYGLVSIILDWTERLNDLSVEAYSEIILHAAFLVLGFSLAIGARYAYLFILLLVSAIRLYLIVYDVVLPMARDPLVMLTEEEFFLAAGHLVFAAGTVLLFLYLLSPRFIEKAAQRLFYLPAALIAASVVLSALSFGFSAGASGVGDAFIDFLKNLPLTLLLAGGYFLAGINAKRGSRSTED